MTGGNVVGRRADKIRENLLSKEPQTTKRNLLFVGLPLDTKKKALTSFPSARTASAGLEKKKGGDGGGSFRPSRGE